MNSNDLHGLLVNYGPWLVLGVGLGAVALTAVAFCAFLFTHLIGEQKGEEHGHGHADAHH
jgi:uncharacterized membrane protein YdjX (TVP38/TMEM64 family)